MTRKEYEARRWLQRVMADREGESLSAVLAKRVLRRQVRELQQQPEIEGRE